MSEMKTVIIVGAALALATAATAVGTVADNQLACNVMAQNLASKPIDSGDLTVVSHSVRGHYVLAQDKCFIVVRATFSKPDPSLPGGIFKMTTESLHEVFDQRPALIGIYAQAAAAHAVSICYVKQDTCNSLAEWEYLLKPYMEG